MAMTTFLPNKLYEIKYHENDWYKLYLKIGNWFFSNLKNLTFVDLLYEFYEVTNKRAQMITKQINALWKVTKDFNDFRSYKNIENKEMSYSVEIKFYYSIDYCVFNFDFAKFNK